MARARASWSPSTSKARRTKRRPRQIARAIANSPLVKTAIAGSDPNWGRILCAAGYAGVAFDPRKADIDMQGMAVCRGGSPPIFREAELKHKLDEPDCSDPLRHSRQRQGPRALLDLRFHRRLHPDQRQLPDMILRTALLLLFSTLALADTASGRPERLYAPPPRR